MINGSTLTKPFRNNLSNSHQVNLKELEQTTTRIINRIRKSSYWDDRVCLLEALEGSTGVAGVARLAEDTLMITSKPRIAEAIQTCVRSLIPWRMGPFKINDLEIDGEWRSDLQWRMLSCLTEEISNQRIADIGCSSGYLSARLALEKECFVVGIDPVERCFLQSRLISSLAGLSNLAVLPLALADCKPFENYFDIAFCLGVLYHQRNPHLALKQLSEMLVPGGTLILESITALPHNNEDVIIPSDRYAKMRNCWMVPTSGKLGAWITSAGFSSVQQLYSYPITPIHQRSTLYSPYESIQDFLDPQDQTKTIEGYPAPWKTAYKAFKEDE